MKFFVKSISTLLIISFLWQEIIWANTSGFYSLRPRAMEERDSRVSATGACAGSGAGGSVEELTKMGQTLLQAEKTEKTGTAPIFSSHEPPPLGGGYGVKDLIQHIRDGWPVEEIVRIAKGNIANRTMTAEEFASALAKLAASENGRYAVRCRTVAEAMGGETLDLFNPFSSVRPPAKFLDRLVFGKQMILITFFTSTICSLIVGIMGFFLFGMLVPWHVLILLVSLPIGILTFCAVLALKETIILKYAYWRNRQFEEEFGAGDISNVRSLLYELKNVIFYYTKQTKGIYPLLYMYRPPGTFLFTPSLLAAGKRLLSSDERVITQEDRRMYLELVKDVIVLFIIQFNQSLESTAREDLLAALEIPKYTIGKFSTYEKDEIEQLMREILALAQREEATEPRTYLHEPIMAAIIEIMQNYMKRLGEIETKPPLDRLRPTTNNEDENEAVPLVEKEENPPPSGKSTRREFLGAILAATVAAAEPQPTPISKEALSAI